MKHEEAFVFSGKRWILDVPSDENGNDMRANPCALFSLIWGCILEALPREICALQHSAHLWTLLMEGIVVDKSS